MKRVTALPLDLVRPLIAATLPRLRDRQGSLGGPDYAVSHHQTGTWLLDGKWSRVRVTITLDPDEDGPVTSHAPEPVSSADEVLS